MHAASNALTPVSRGIDPVVVLQVQAIVITVFAIVIVLASTHMRRPLAEVLPADDSRDRSGDEPWVQPAS
ncbi:MAG: hypothetical protein ACR2H0_00550 [Candidatus Limnocylindrales bacterium]